MVETMKADALQAAAAAIARADAVSFDVWDTVLRRRCHPDAVKLLAAEAVLAAHADCIRPQFQSATHIWQLRRERELQLARHARRQGHSAEYRLQDVWQAVAALIGEAEGVARLATAAVALEFDIECRMSWVDPDWLQLTTALGGRQAFYLSDFYMGRAMLDRLLVAHGLGELLPTGYVSCDEMAAKHDGRLYGKVREQLQLQGKRWVHVGDNLHSDVAMARAQGVDGWLFQPEQGHELRCSLEQRFSLRLRNMNAYWADSLAARHEEEAARSLGRRYAPLFAGFALHTLQRARQLGVDKVTFFTREGEFFQAVYDRLLLASGERGPQSALLHVSRMATFAASLAAPSIGELQRLWSQYTRQSPSALMCSLGANPDAFSPWFEAHGLPMDEEVAHPATDARFQALFADSGFSAALGQLLREKREALCEYLQQQGLDATEQAPVLVVDIGWRGTIQNNLALLQPQRHWHGLYLGLLPPLNAEPGNTGKQAYVADLRSDMSWQAWQRLSFAAPAEMLSNSARGSVTAYSAGKVIEDVVSGESAVFNSFTCHFQQGVLDGVDVCAAAMSLDGVGAGEMRQQALKLWDELIERPDPLIRRAFRQLSHNESFGMGRQVEFENRLTTGLILRAPWSPDRWRALRQALAATQWKGALQRDTETPLLVRALLLAERLLLRARHGCMMRKRRCS